MQVQIVYADLTAQSLVSLHVPKGTNVIEAIRLSGILERHPQLQLHPLWVGIYGIQVSNNSPLREGDRVEIYRCLKHDPKEARRRRAEQQSNLA